MILWIEGYDRHYEMENLCRIFFPYQKIEVRFAHPDGEKTEQAQAWLRVKELAEKVCFLAWASMNGQEKSREEEACETDFSGLIDFERRREYERHLGVLLFGILSELCGCEPKWGILTGIHPVKLLRQLTRQQGEEAAMDFFLPEAAGFAGKNRACPPYHGGTKTIFGRKPAGIVQPVFVHTLLSHPLLLLLLCFPNSGALCPAHP